MTECAHPPGCGFCRTGISTPELVAEAGVTYRQVDYWSRIGLLRPARIETGNIGQGGIAREWDAEELRVAQLMGRLTAAGIGPRTAEQVARSPKGRFEVGPGIWVEVDEQDTAEGRRPRVEAAH
jgi:DNA-binding transcriptional MerR regulator